MTIQEHLNKAVNDLLITYDPVTGLYNYKDVQIILRLDKRTALYEIIMIHDNTIRQAWLHYAAESINPSLEYLYNKYVKLN